VREERGKRGEERDVPLLTLSPGSASAAQCCVCHFPLVNTTCIHAILHRLRYRVELVKLSLLNGVPLTHSFSENSTVSHMLPKLDSCGLHFLLQTVLVCVLQLFRRTSK